jgi:trimethylamine-N-oxide reductase cytochrome c-type subunit TorC
MHGAVCGSCHSITPANHFLANQWIGGLKDMKQFINLETEEYYLLQKYLQMHAQDVEGERH